VSNLSRTTQAVKRMTTMDDHLRAGACISHLIIPGDRAADFEKHIHIT
jgi:hypothetical protein